jgi:hypothetical protein
LPIPLRGCSLRELQALQLRDRRLDRNMALFFLDLPDTKQTAQRS